MVYLAEMTVITTAVYGLSYCFSAVVETMVLDVAVSNSFNPEGKKGAAKALLLFSMYFS